MQTNSLISFILFLIKVVLHLFLFFHLSFTFEIDVLHRLKIIFILYTKTKDKHTKRNWNHETQFMLKEEVKKLII